jgi:UDPglucose 6-dehydrogenase
LNISIIGSGHVGLVTGACLAELGHCVVCVDNDEEKIEKLNRGEMPFYEPGLQEIVRFNFLEGRLRFSNSIAEGTRHGEVLFIAVGTPPKPTGEADLSAIERVCREIGANMTGYRVVVEKSTVPVQTGEWVARNLQKYAPTGLTFDVASVPEFLREGSAVHDFKHPDRIVIGVSSDRAAGLLVKIFEPLNAPILLTDIKSAELIKHSANAFLAMKISFINAVAHICEISGADVGKVAKGIGLDSRIGMEFLQPGIGFGGSCFPKDLSGFIAISQQLGYDFQLLKEVENINRLAREWAMSKLLHLLGGSLLGRTIGVLGLSFKPGTDDVRESPALWMIGDLLKMGAGVRACDPVSIENARQILGDSVEYFQDPYEACTGVDALLITTEWSVFRELNLLHLKSVMKTPIVVDGRNLFEPFRMKEIGFQYAGVGRAALGQEVRG